MYSKSFSSFPRTKSASEETNKSIHWPKEPRKSSDAAKEGGNVDNNYITKEEDYYGAELSNFPIKVTTLVGIAPNGAVTPRI